MQQQVQRVIRRFLFAAVLLISVKVQRESCDRFRQDSHTGVHCRHLHSAALVYDLAGGAPAHVKGKTAAGRPVHRLISGFEQSAKDSQSVSPSFQK